MRAKETSAPGNQNAFLKVHILTPLCGYYASIAYHAIRVHQSNLTRATMSIDVGARAKRTIGLFCRAERRRSTATLIRWVVPLGDWPTRPSGSGTGELKYHRIA